MNNTKQAIFMSVYRILVKGQKHYANPSVDSIIELVSQRHETDIGRRWAFQCLHDLEAAGYINRQERFRKDPDGGWKQIPSLISITLKGARKLFSQGVEGAARLCKEIMGWIRGGDKRWPNYQAPVVPSAKLTTTTSVSERISELARGAPTWEKIMEMQKLNALT